VPTHRVDECAVATPGIVRVGTTLLPDLSRDQEAIHRAAVDVVDGIGFAVWTSAIHVIRIVKWSDARSAVEAWQTGQRNPGIIHWDSVCQGEGPEVMIEGPVLLHDDDDVFDFLQTARPGVGPAVGSRIARAAGMCASRAEQHSDDSLTKRSHSAPSEPRP
jgi:hypothetical protein